MVRRAHFLFLYATCRLTFACHRCWSVSLPRIACTSYRHSRWPRSGYSLPPMYSKVRDLFSFVYFRLYLDLTLTGPMFSTPGLGFFMTFFYICIYVQRCVFRVVFPFGSRSHHTAYCLESSRYLNNSDPWSSTTLTRDCAFCRPGSWRDIKQTARSLLAGRQDSPRSRS